MDKIFIENLLVEGILGIHPHEQRAPQKIRISASVTTDITQAAVSDDVLKSVNYSTLTKDIIRFIKNSHYRTIEALIEALAEELLTNERVESIWLIPEAEAVGVEINRTK